MKKIRFGLLPRIILAILLGVACGHVLPAWCVRVFVTFNGIFSEFLGFIIPLIIVGLVVPAIADIGKGAGRMLLVTVLVAYGATLFSGFLSYFTGELAFPYLIDPDASLSGVSDSVAPEPYFTVPIPPMMDVMTALVLAFTLGLGVAGLASKALKQVFDDFRKYILFRREKGSRESLFPLRNPEIPVRLLPDQISGSKKPDVRLFENTFLCSRYFQPSTLFQFDCLSGDILFAIQKRTGIVSSFLHCFPAHKSGRFLLHIPVEIRCLGQIHVASFHTIVLHIDIYCPISVQQWGRAPENVLPKIADLLAKDIQFHWQ